MHISDTVVVITIFGRNTGLRHGAKWVACLTVDILSCQIKRTHLTSGKITAHTPLHALGGNAVVKPQAFKNPQRFLCATNAARRFTSCADRVVFVQNRHRHIVQIKCLSQTQASKLGADEHSVTAGG